MKVTTVLNGEACLILTPEDILEKEVLKKLNGGIAQTIASNVSILQNSVTDGLMITSGTKEKEPKKQN